MHRSLFRCLGLGFAFAVAACAPNAQVGEGSEGGAGGESSGGGASGADVPMQSAGRAGGGGGGTVGVATGGSGPIAGAGGDPTGGSGGRPLMGICPIAPPIDETDNDVVQRCTQPLVAAVGNGRRRALSVDGQNWFGDVWFPSGGTDQNEESHRDVAIGNGLVVMVGDGGIFVSRDAGLTFAKTDMGRSLHNSSVVFFKGAFWIAAGGGVHTSSDGLQWKSWKENDMLPGGLKASFGAQAGATDGKQALFVSGRSYRSFNGQAWSQGNISGGGIDDLTFGNGRFAGVSSFSASSAISTDGRVWSADASGNDLRFDTIVWTGKQFFASGSRYDGNAQTSPDGLTWTRHKMNTPIGAVTMLGDIYVGANSGTLYRSTDGRNWTLPHRAAGDINWGFSRLASGPVLKASR